MEDENRIIYNRKINLCPNLQDLLPPEIVYECYECEDFFLHCCSCHREQLDRPTYLPAAKPCHHYRIIFTDGACTNNGQSTATAGIGIACGRTADSQWSVPITDVTDNFPLRSSQRAELLAAKLGIEFFATADRMNNGDPKDRPKGVLKAWIITTDSEYVAKGMTEWLPKWKKNDWKTSKGTTPVNLDLFLALDALIEKHETADLKIGFWRIPREHNELADRLAKEAAVLGDIATVTNE